MTQGMLEPIPWEFTDEPGVLQWTWLTDHFVAKIVGTAVSALVDATDRRVVRAYSWELADLIRRQQGMPRVLIEGTSESYEDAERSLREHVGKSYDRTLGYARYAGALAFTFTLSTGEERDVSDLVGTTTVVTILQPDRSEKSISGEFAVDHYRWRLTTPTHEYVVVPEHVVRVTNRSDAAEAASQITRPHSYVGIGRIYREEPRRGCTGRPGFEVGTVDHAGAPRCPLHEEGIPEHLLR
jgi:hypothetical protein